LDLKGKIVTIAAMGTQKGIAKQIIEAGGDYVLAVKKNQGKLFQEMQFVFETDRKQDFKGAPYDYAETVNKGHGGIETRCCWAISDPEYLRNFVDDWAGLKSLVFIESERLINNKKESSMRYFISSMEGKASDILSTQRSHWEIGNSLHWILDIACNEDRCWVRKDNAPDNFSIIRKMSLNLLKQDKSLKVGIRAKRLRCGWDQAYSMRVLSQ